MKKGMFGLCLLVLTGVAALRAQTPLRGEVRDAGGQPVAYASVVVRADSTETGAFKGYATTAEDGSFEVPGGASGAITCMSVVSALPRRACGCPIRQPGWWWCCTNWQKCWTR
ncbi:MAG: carboxypeptidase-like regulatory domain-containing protein [Candidatus Bacteroides intestinipullorum]|uniref:Carboxypeptidase-like regulatory domain-containing protein n=1 Tax=Candidatus Bacteroides intestinipullorum TaxID=2838471 RepID=A0A9E2KGC4_9BACE|nr:carboxypeptidase-like regulatory domain-containing protein [Candidatus Bacteroides intestinipullorum]